MRLISHKYSDVRHTLDVGWLTSSSAIFREIYRSLEPERPSVQART